MEEKTDVKQDNLTKYDKKNAGNDTILNPDRDTHHNPAMQAVERIFDYRERRLRTNVNEQMLQDAVDAVEHMASSAPDYDLLVTALGMAEREYRALEHQHGKPGNSQGNNSSTSFTSIDGISLEEINKHLARDGFEDEVLWPFDESGFDSGQEQTETDGKEKESASEDSSDVLPEDIDKRSPEENIPAEGKNKAKKRAQAARRKKAKENAERSRRKYAEYEKLQQQKQEERIRQEELRNNAEAAAEASRQTAEEAQHYQKIQRQREQHIRDWEIAKHGENLVSAEASFQKQEQPRNHAQDQAKNPARHEAYYQPQNRQEAPNQHFRHGNISGIGVTEDASNLLEHPISNNSAHDQDKSPASRIQDRDNTYTAPSYFDQQRRQQIEDDIRAKAQEQADENNRRLSQMAEAARERWESAEAFSRQRHSAIYARNEDLQKKDYREELYKGDTHSFGGAYADHNEVRKEEPPNPYAHPSNAESPHVDGVYPESSTRHRTPHHYHSDNYRPSGTVIGGAEGIADGSAASKGSGVSLSTPSSPIATGYASYTDYPQQTGSSSADIHGYSQYYGSGSKTHAYKKLPVDVEKLVGNTNRNNISDRPQSYHQSYSAFANQESTYKDDPAKRSVFENISSNNSQYQKLSAQDRKRDNRYANENIQYYDGHTTQDNTRADGDAADSGSHHAGIYSSKDKYRTYSYQNTPHSPAQEGSGPGGTSSIGTVIGKGADIPSAGNVFIINKKDYSSLPHSGSAATIHEHGMGSGTNAAAGVASTAGAPSMSDIATKAVSASPTAPHGTSTHGSATPKSSKSGHLETDTVTNSADLPTSRREKPYKSKGSGSATDTITPARAPSPARPSGRPSKLSDYSKLAAGSTVGVASAGAEAFFSGAWKKHLENLGRRSSFEEAATATTARLSSDALSSGITAFAKTDSVSGKGSKSPPNHAGLFRKTDFPEKAVSYAKASATRQVHPSLEPTVGMRTTAFDAASRRKVSIDQASRPDKEQVAGKAGISGEPPKADNSNKSGRAVTPNRQGKSVGSDKSGRIEKPGRSEEPQAASEQADSEKKEIELETIAEREAEKEPSAKSKAAPAHGAKTDLNSKIVDRERERSSESVEKAGRTPSERRIGMAYARITHTRFISAVREPMGRAGKTLAGAVLGVEALRETDVGQGLYRLRRGTAYARGAVAAAGLAGTLASSGGRAAANAGRAFGYGANYFRGKDRIGGTAVKKGAYIIPVRRITAARQWEAFGETHKDLANEFTRTVTIKRSTVTGSTFKAIQMEKRLSRQALDVSVNLAGDRTYLILDHKALKAEIGRLLAKSGGRDFTEADALRLRSLREMQAKGIGKISSRVNTQKIRKYKRSIENVSHMFAMYLSRSDNAGAKSIQLIVTSGKFIRAGLKVQLKAIQLGTHTKPGKFLTRQAGRVASAAAQTAAQNMKNAAAGGLNLVSKGADHGIAKAAGIDYNHFRSVKKAYIESVKKGLREGINGGIYNRVSVSIAKAGRKIGGSVAQTEAGKGLVASGRRIGGGFAKLKQAGEKITRTAGQAAKAVQKPFVFLIDRVFNPASIALSFAKRVLLIGAASFSLFLFIFVLAGTALMGSQLMFTTGSDNLQKYINYAIKVSEDWFAGRLTDSKTLVGSRRMSLDEVYGKGGNETGRYRIVTTKYVDQDGKEVDSNDNIKEILSMASVKTFNTWPEDWQAVNNPFDGNDWTVKELQDMISGLYAASHSWEAAEKGPYIYYKEANNQRVRLLEDPEYPGTGYTYRSLKGDAQGEACRGPRAFFCTEASYPAYSSEYRREMDASYGERGGCTLDYAGYGTYDAADDSFTLDGQLHDGTRVVYNAHAMIWATDDMKARHAASQANGGGGDESRIKHERTYGSPAWGCADYTEGHEHEESSTDNPPVGCTNFSLETPQYTDIMAFPQSFPQSVTYSWNIENARYEYIHDGLIYYLTGDYYYYPYNTITFHYRPNIGYSAPSGCDIYMPEGTVFYCDDTYYDCHEIEYYCTGHREWVKIYYCPGHEEYYCDKNHYDLDISIHISHFGNGNELLHNDVENAYTYRRKAKAVSEYPAGFDKNAEKPTDDFYWDKENTNLAAMLAASNWEELYENIEGVDDVTVELNADTIKKYREYLDAAHIAAWLDGIPKDKNGVDVTMHGTEEWFYDETKGRYVKVRREYAELGLYTYEVIETSATSPSQLSALRKKIINNALDAVGIIPYEESGAPVTGSTLSDYGWADKSAQEVRRGLSSGGFVAWVYQISGKNITNTDDIKKIWDRSTAIGDRKSVADDDLKPGDLGFINSYDDRLNEEVAQTQEDLIPYNTVAVYLGTNELGQRIWIQCSRTNGVVSVTTSNAFNYFRRVNGVP